MNRDPDIMKCDAQNRTRKHYENHPFDFLDGISAETIEEVQPLPFRRFVTTYLVPGNSVIDVGCGPGRDLLYLHKCGMRVTGVDISEQSLFLARKRIPDTTLVCASNLNLPFDNLIFDAVVSDGVIHHTPDPHAAFLENTRLLRKNGFMYVAVYRRWRYYYYIYTYIGRPIRRLAKYSWGRAVVHALFLPLYYLVHFLKSRGKRSWQAAKNLFYDYIITPKATFHTYEEIVSWGIEAGLTLVEYDEKGLGNCHAFVFKK